MDKLIEYLFTNGGAMGAALAAAISWIVFREKTIADSKKEIPPSTGEDVKALSKEITDSHAKTVLKLDEMAKTIDAFKEINLRQARISKNLQERLQQSNDDRIDELKEILQDYSRAMNDLSLALDKTNFYIEKYLDRKSNREEN